MDILWIWNLSLCIFILDLTTSIEIKIRRTGRHICQRDQVVMRPVRRVQTFRRPYYQRIVMPCPHTNQLCNKYRLQYRIAQRSVFHMMPQHEQAYSCCPGWTGYSYRYHGCMQPICKRRCQNGGYCSKPDQCTCLNGWSGDCCQNDDNECNGKHDCQQICNNFPGGYNCTCYDGFMLQNNNKTCEICLSCSDEYRELESENRRLRREIMSLETEMSLLNRTMNSVTEKLTKISHTVHDRQSNGGAVNGVLSPEVEDMLVRLTERVGQLEESSGQCFCKSEIARAQNDVYKEFKRMEKALDTRISFLEFEQVEPPPSFTPLWIEQTVTEKYGEGKTTKGALRQSTLP